MFFLKRSIEQCFEVWQVAWFVREEKWHGLNLTYVYAHFMWAANQVLLRDEMDKAALLCSLKCSSYRNNRLCSTLEREQCLKVLLFFLSFFFSFVFFFFFLFFLSFFLFFYLFIYFYFIFFLGKFLNTS